MAKSKPNNGNDYPPFLAKVLGDDGKYYPLMPDATSSVCGGVYLSDEISEKNALTGMTALTPKALSLFQNNVDSKLGNITIRSNGITAGTAQVNGSNITIDLTNLDASTLTNGTIPFARIPKSAVEELIVVKNKKERLALTIEKVQNGDVVKELDTGNLYYVIKQEFLGTSTPEDAFEEFSAGTAAQASKLTPGATIQTKLDSENAVTFTGETNINPGVTGTLPIKHGGTGASTSEGAWSNLGGGAVGKKDFPNTNQDTQFLRGDGTWATVSTEDNKTKQTNNTNNTAYPILLKNGTGAGEITNGVLFNSNVTINPSTGTIKATTFDGTATSATTAGICTGNAASASKWQTSRTLSLTGNVTGSVTGVDGSGNISISTTIADNAVTTGKINNSAVTTAKINDSAITTAKINDSAVTLAKLNTNVQTVFVGTTAPTDSHVTIWIDTN